VYSLGIILYELLAGAPPLDLRKVAFEEFLRKLREEEPPKPSTRIRTQDPSTSTDLARKRQSEPVALANQMRGDLDCIALKALEKDRTRRYASPSEFAQDIGRYLKNEAVLAVPPSAAYRARKFAARYSWQLAAVALIIASLTAGLVISLAAERRANRRFNQVRQLANHFLFDFHDEIANKPGTLKAREMIVSTALEYLNSLAKDADGDPGLQWEMAVAWARVANAQGSEQRPSLGRPKDAIVSYEKAIALATPLADRKLLTTRQREQFLNFLCDEAGIRRSQRDYPGAVKLQREAVARSEGLRPYAHSRPLGELGITLGLMGDLTGALKSVEEMLPISQQIVKDDPAYLNRLRLADTWMNLARQQQFLTEFDTAKASAAEAVSELRQLRKERPDDSRISQSLLVSISILADIEGTGQGPSLGHFPEAAALYEDSLAAIAPVIAADPHDNNTRLEVGWVHQYLADTTLSLAPRRAVAESIKALELLEQNPADTNDVAVSARISGANAHLALHELPDAERLLTESGRLLKKRGADVEADLNLAWGRLETDRGHHAEAAARFQKALDIDEELLNKTPVPFTAWNITRALELAAQAVPETSTARRHRAVEIWTDQTRRWPGHPWIARQLALASKRQ
jgi:tetratricopeptide (TPR) repeat protein